MVSGVTLLLMGPGFLFRLPSRLTVTGDKKEESKRKIKNLMIIGTIWKKRGRNLKRSGKRRLVSLKAAIVY